MSRFGWGVAHCESHDNYFALGNGCEYCGMDDELERHFESTPEPPSPQARTVLEAAEAWAAELDASGTGWWQAWDPGTPILAIAEASRAYRASLQPGVKPEEVETGARFRFVGFPHAGPFTLARIYRAGAEETELVYLHDDFVAVAFDETDRIIPLPKDQ